MTQDLEMRFQALCNEQGWNDAGKIDIALQFIEEKKLSDAFMAYARDVQEIENELLKEGELDADS